MDIIAGKLITKEKRQELFGNIAGGAGSIKPENYQRKKIIEHTNIDCKKTSIRINLRTIELVAKSHPNINEDGYDYSEDFDGIQIKGKNTIYINLKCIVGKGGTQTRSLREVYWFIEGQLHILKNNQNIYFANILDGDEAYNAMSKYKYILSLPKFANVKDNVYIGDLKDYIIWFNNKFNNQDDNQ